MNQSIAETRNTWAGRVSLYPSHLEFLEAVGKQRGVKHLSSNLQFVLDQHRLFMQILNADFSTIQSKLPDTLVYSEK